MSKILSMFILAYALWSLGSCGNNGSGVGDASDLGATCPVVQDGSTISVEEAPRSTPTIRPHYIAFNITNGTITDIGRFKLALKKQGEAIPTVVEMESGAGVFRTLNATNGKTVIMAYDIASTIESLHDTLKSQNHANVVAHGAAVDVDARLLTPGTKYTLYAVQAKGASGTALCPTTVYDLGDFSTDTIVEGNIPIPAARTLNDESLFPNDYGYYSNYVKKYAPIRFDISDSAVILPVFVGLENVEYIDIRYDLNDDGGYTATIYTFENNLFKVISSNKDENNIPGLLIPSVSVGNNTHKGTVGSTDFISAYLLLSKDNDIVVHNNVIYTVASFLPQKHFSLAFQAE